MVSSGGFGGGPTLPMGDSNLMVSVIILVLIIAAIVFLVTRVFEV